MSSIILDKIKSSSGNVNIVDTVDATNTTSGSFVISGGLGVAKKIFAGTSIHTPILNVSGNINSTNATSGSVVISGGVGIALDVFTSGSITSSGILNITANNNAVSTSTGAVRIVGGIGVQADIFCGGTITANNISAGFTQTGVTITGTPINVVNNVVSGVVVLQNNIHRTIYFTASITPESANTTCTVLYTIPKNVNFESIIDARILLSGFDSTNGSIQNLYGNCIVSSKDIQVSFTSNNTGIHYIHFDISVIN